MTELPCIPVVPYTPPGATRQEVEINLIETAIRCMRSYTTAAASTKSGRWHLRDPQAVFQHAIADDADGSLIAETTTIPHYARHIAAWDPESTAGVVFLLNDILYLMKRRECPASLVSQATTLAATWLRWRPEDVDREALC